MMVVMAIALSSANPALVNRTAENAACALGRVVLNDVASSWPNGKEVLISLGTRDEDTLFALCPDLLLSLPANMRPASEAEKARLSDIMSPNPVTIFHLDAPKISRTGQTAVVSYSYSCNGLCGAGYKARYKLTRKVWKRAGDEKRVWVS